MKKINKINLKLDKEVISSLSENELSSAKGGVVQVTGLIETIKPTGQMSTPGVECFVLSMNIKCKPTDINCQSINDPKCLMISNGCPVTNICLEPERTFINC